MKSFGRHSSRRNDGNRHEHMPGLETSNILKSLLTLGSQNAVKNCMNIGSQDRVVIITDAETMEIGNSLLYQAMPLTRKVTLLLLERYGERPFTRVPSQLAADLRSLEPTVTFYAATCQEGEDKFRGLLIVDLLTKELKVRHAHMPGVTEQMMETGMQINYTELAKFNQKVADIVKPAKEIVVTSSLGTNLTVTFDRSLRDGDNPKRRWHDSNGLIHEQGKWGNIPTGEVFTSPENVNGILVVDGVLGSHFDKKYGILKDHPVTFRIKNSLLVEIACENKTLLDELWAYLHSVENGNRVGEFAIGTNIELRYLIGNMLQDEKFPGIHLAFGDTLSSHTGATWESDIHVDCVPLRPSIWVDGRRIMEEGLFKL